MKRLVRTFSLFVAGTLAIPALVLSSASSAEPPSPIVDSADCLQHEIPANDDSYSSEVALPFGINFYGQNFQRLWVNNNGNVTFDGPLGTYTPFGLVGTGAEIIAPFFADVDTRVGQTVTYGWGDTTFQGHRAFCANWINVGYYSGHTDKVNSFQLLIVQREDTGVPGDFDIIFNYDQVQWETGDASGGSNGLGGYSARAGFSNGSGDPNFSYELPGSGINGGLLDSNTTTGLTNYSTTSSVLNSGEIIPGRHIFPVRSGGAPLTKYVALGDSYQSGEGAGDYLDGTDTSSNKCHRSPNAYPQRLVDDGIVHLTLDFGACSGAKTSDLGTTLSTDRPPYDDGMSQYDRLDASTKLVTIGVGGNDLDFSGILKDCIKSIALTTENCHDQFDQRLQDNWNNLVDNHLLATVYRQVRSRAPYARIAVLGYPRFYVEGGQGTRALDQWCAGVRLTDQIWINEKIRELDDHIRDQARALGLQFIDTYDTPDGHELCSGATELFMNGVKFFNQVESYHPNKYGHGLLENEVAKALLSLPPGELFNVRPGETLNYTFPVNGAGFDASTQWPGSDVVLSLTSPSGRVIDRDTLGSDVTHEVGPTFESYHVKSPEAGIWTATLYGARVAAEGEQARLDVYQAPASNTSPTARIQQSVAGRTVTVDGSTSSDPDGSIVKYLWEFGDGATATGSTATHTYTKAGTYLVTLAVQDDRGHWSVTSAPGTVDVPAYDFSGFFAPVNNEPTANTTKAGAAVPVKFSLGGDFGLGILVTGSPSSVSVNCDTGVEADEIETTVSAGSSSLQYDPDAGVYTYVWKTAKAWADSCRRFKLTLDDGTVRTALFRFR